MGISRKDFSADSSDYELLEEIGFGASATVHRAIYLPSKEIIAVKCLDLERCNSNLDDVQKEAQIMSLIDHPNVIRAFCSFVVDHCLWVVMPFMAEGSCLHLMKIAYPEGFEEYIICSILKESLKALEYLHRHGHIHRDVKAGNILLDSTGVVKLGDFGVSACMFDRGDRQRTRNTFVGTPCWMAPEVLQPGNGYDFKADIWSFGITALELAHGHAPFSKYPPMKVLLMTIQNAPPGLDYDRDKRFSKSFKEMVAMCLVKDQTKRPTAEKLLKHSFFKNAKAPELSVKSLLTGLPPLWERVKQLQLKDAAQLALKEMPSAAQEALSQSEYKRGVSAWNFDVDDLKAQASLVQDDDGVGLKEENGNIGLYVDNKHASGSGASVWEFGLPTNNVNSKGSGDDPAESLNAKAEIVETETLRPAIQEINDVDEKGGSSNGANLSRLDKPVVQEQCKTQTNRFRQSMSGPLVPNVSLNHSVPERRQVSERSDNEVLPGPEKSKRDIRKAPSFSGPLMLPTRASANSLSAPIRSSGGLRESLDDKSKSNVVQIKGRFSVTSENLDNAKGASLRKSASVGDWLLDSKQLPTTQPPKEVNNVAVPTSVILPYLQNLFHQTSLQQDLIVNLLNSCHQADSIDVSPTGKLPPLPRPTDNEVIVESPVSDRERLLDLQISELRVRMNNLTEELKVEKAKHMQLQQHLSAAYVREDEDGSRRGRRDT
ncbi:non-specific serine/threonine protein kinase [Ranunculus cassubicifolius]